MAIMHYWIWLLGFLVLYVALTQWLLPKFGIPRWRPKGYAGSRRST